LDDERGDIGEFDESNKWRCGESSEEVDWETVPSTLDIKQQNMFYNTIRQSFNSKQKSIKFDGKRPEPRSNKIDR
jgi:hypothetical protein